MVGIINIGYKDSFEIHTESKMNRCAPRIFHWQMGGLALRLYIIYIQFEKLSYKNHVISITVT
jgi:hypothetical protein